MSIEAMKQALAIINDYPYRDDENINKAVNLLGPAIAKAEKQEPVAWGMVSDGEICDCITLAEHEREQGEYTVPLYAAPPQREWIGLTDEEWLYIWDEAGTDMWIQNGREDAERMIEAKLKEKNHAP